MDSLTQFALGSAVSVAVMGRRTAIWKAALWGGLFGTLPDLDTFIDHGDPVSNMTYHRAESHALFWLTLASPVLAGLPALLHRQREIFRFWWLAAWLALVTHPLLDWCTVYGTQFGLPFTDRPFGLGSIFIIDPLYTVPLLAGCVAAALRGNERGLRLNRAGLVLSTLYLAWSLAAQQYVLWVVAKSLRAQGVQAKQVLATPTPFNTLLWRVVVITPGGYMEGFRSLLDRADTIHFDRFGRGEALYEAMRGQRHVDRMAWFTRGFFKMEEVQRSGSESQILITDLRMGQEPTYTFSFVVGERDSAGHIAPVEPPGHAGRRPDVERALSWLWRRALGQDLAPPR